MNMKVKKLLSGLTAMLMIVSMTVYLPISASAASSGSCGDTATYELDDNGVLTINGTGEVTQGWSSYRASITKVIVNNGITSIADRVFSDHSKLIDVTLPDSLTSLGAYAFNSCSALKSIIIPKNVTTIKSMTFSGCNNPDLIIEIEGVLTSLEANPRLQRNDAFRKVTGTIKVHDQATFNLIKEYDSALNVVLSSSVDTTALDKVIESANKYTSSSSFTAESYTALTEAIKAGETAKGKGDAAQSDINNAAKAIRDAVAGLVKADDKSNTPLKAKIDEANGLAAMSSVYTSDSIAALKEAIKTAQGVYDKIILAVENLPEEAELISALDTLIKAMTIDETGESETGLKKLVTQETWLKLNDAHNKAINTTDTNYTPESYEVFKQARDAFEEIYNKGQGGVTEAEALKAIADINAAFEKLVEKTEFDFSALEAAVEKAKPIVEDPQASETYTSSTLNALKEAYKTATSILADRESVKDQTTIYNATSNLNNKVNELVKVDKEALYNELQQAISDAEARDADIYTDDTYKTFKDALDAAKKITMSSTVDQIETATANLKAAIEGLKVDQDIIPAGGPLGYIYHTWTETPFYSGTTDDAMVGATQIRLTFDCADDTSFNRYFNVNYTVNVGTTKSDTEVRGTATEENLGEKGCTAILNLNSPIEAGKSYNIIGYTYGYNNSKDYVFAITKIEFLDANGKILKTITDITAAKEQLDAAIAKAGAVDAAAYTAESYAELTKAVDAAKALTDKATVAEITAAKDAIEAAIKALVPIEVPVLGAIEGTIKTPGADAEVTVTVATADGETVAEATAANGEYSISDLEDGEYIVTFAADGYAARSYTAAVAGGSVTLEAEIHLYGDVNGDGEITTADAGMANSHAREVSALEGYDFDVAEVTGDGEVTTADVGVINATAQKI